MTDKEIKEYEVNSKLLSEFLGITERQVYYLAKKRMPFENGKGNLLECVNWYIKQKDDDTLVHAKIKHTEAQTKKIDLDIKERKKALISAKKYLNFTAEILVALKNELLSLGQTLGIELANEENSAVIKSKIDERIREALNKCSENFNGV